MTKILAWDVGIKNLAYCYLDNKKIIDWGLIDLVDNKIEYCKSLMKNKKICNKVAKYKGIINENDEEYYCKSHIKSHVITELEEIDTLEKCNKCKVKAKYINNNIYYCLKHKTQYINSRVPKIVKTVGCYDKSLETLGLTMIKKLDLLNISELDYILIENQPSLINPTMKTISSFLFFYFVEKKNRFNLNVTIKFVSPANKLKLNLDEINVLVNLKDVNIIKVCEKINILPIVGIKALTNRLEFDKECVILKLEAKEILKNKKMYELTKLLAIKYTELLIKDEDKWLNLLKNAKKKDDLCDAFLHALLFNI